MSLRERRENTLEMGTPYDILVEENIAGLLYLENDIISYANPSFIDVVKSSAAEVIGSSIFDWIEGACFLALKEGLEKIYLGEKEEFSKNLGLKGSDNVFFSLHLRAVKREEGKTMMVGASRNSTKRVTRKIQFYKEQSRYRSLFENTIAGIMIYNYDREEVVECNKAALDLMGYKDNSEIQGKSRFEFVPETSEYFPGVKMHRETDKHGTKIKNGISFNTSGSFLTKEGNSFLVQASVTPTFQEYGEGFIIFHDVTSEILNKKANKEIEKQHRDIFNNSNDAIIYVDINTKKSVLCNDNALNLLEVKNLEGLESKTLADSLHKESLEGMEAEEFIDYHIAKALKDGRNKTSFWIEKKDGELRRIDCLLIRSLSNPKNPKIIIFLIDITYMYNAQTTLNEKNEELKKYIDSNMQLENFAYLASHDLQTPLRSIISFTQLLEKRLGHKLNYETKEYMDFIIDSGKNMKDLIYDLLSYSRVNTEKINLDIIDVQELIQKVQLELSFDIENKSAIIDVDINVKKINADWNKMKQVFQNLFMNAIKFARKNVIPHVQLKAEEKKDYWEFSIKDNGIGIEKEYQEKIFLLFKRLNRQTDYDGTGIGLAMVKKIIEQHSGTIWVESEYGKGSTFFFTIKK